MIDTNHLIRPLGSTPSSDSPYLGRSQEFRHAERVLRAEGVKRVFLVGEAGVGKSRFASELAQRLWATRDAERDHGPNIYDFNLTLLSTDTVRISEMLDGLIHDLHENPDDILYIEGIFRLFAAGAESCRQYARLRQALEDGCFSFLATIRLSEYRALAKRHASIMNAATTIELAECKEELALQILAGISEKFAAEYHVEISSGALRAAVELSQRYIRNSALPGKAIEVLDKAAHRYAAKRAIKQEEDSLIHDPNSMKYLGAKVSWYDVKRVVEDIAAVDIDGDKASQWTNETARLLNTRVLGQEAANQRLAAALAGVRVRFGRAGRPAGMILLAGPAGVGKTYSIEVIAEMLLKSPDDIARFDLRAYQEPKALERLFGELPGTSGSHTDSGILRVVRDKAFCFLVFNNAAEITAEAATVFETIASQGYLRDHTGHKLRFKRSVLFFLFDSNEEFYPYDDSSDALQAFGRNLLPGSLADKLDAIIPYAPLSTAARLAIVRDRIHEFQRSLNPPRPKLRIDKKVIADIVDGRDGQFGAGNLLKLLEGRLFAPIRAHLNGYETCTPPVVRVTSKGVDLTIRSSESQSIS